MPRSERKRVFLAVWPPPGVVEAIEKTVSEAKASLSTDPVARASIRWIKKASWHLTVVFVGSVDVTAFDDLRRAASAAAAECEPFRLKFKGAGAFPGIRHPRVLWVGVGSGADEWNEFVSQIRSAVGETLPLKREKQHIPHLTIARLRHPVDVGGVLDTLGRIDGAAMSVSKLSLVESVLNPEGAMYRTLEEYELAKSKR